jgi:hypothetical protein
LTSVLEKIPRLVIFLPCLGNKITRGGNKITRRGNKYTIEVPSRV